MCAAPHAYASLARRHRHARFTPPLTSRRTSPRLAVRTSFQPATCLGCLEHGQHVQYVRCTQRRLPSAPQDSSRLPLTTAARLARQGAQAFNQPLAWDVSNVTSMNQMFYVRSAACLLTACSMPPTTQDVFVSPPTSRHTSPRLAVCTQFQSATCLGRLERDQHGQNVPGAQRHPPLHHAKPPATAASPSTPRKTHLAFLFNHVSPRPAVGIPVQPAACLGRLKRDQHGPDVLCAQRRLPPHRSPEALTSHQSMASASSHFPPRLASPGSMHAFSTSRLLGTSRA